MRRFFKDVLYKLNRGLDLIVFLLIATVLCFCSVGQIAAKPRTLPQSEIDTKRTYMTEIEVQGPTEKRIPDLAKYCELREIHTHRNNISPHDEQWQFPQLVISFFGNEIFIESFQEQPGRIEQYGDLLAKLLKGRKAGKVQKKDQGQFVKIILRQAVDLSDLLRIFHEDARAHNAFYDQEVYRYFCRGVPGWIVKAFEKSWVRFQKEPKDRERDIYSL